MKKVILFDIDHTLFDTEKFRETTYKKLAAKLKYNNDREFTRLAREAEEITVRAIGYFDPSLFIKNIIELAESNLKTGDLEKEYLKKDNFEKAVYSEVLPTLRRIKKINNISIGILSTGETKFQRRKVEVLKELLSEEHIHIFVNKLTEIDKVINKYKNFEIYIVDNLLSVLELVKKVAGYVKTVYVRRSDLLEKSGRENFTPDVEVKDLRGILSFIKD